MAARYLIADHDPSLREECRRCLCARGHDVAVAADGLQCLEQLREVSPQVLVLDPDLVWGGGAGVLDCLSAESPVSPVTVVLMNDGGGRHLPERLRRLVSIRLNRPRNLHELLQFVSQMEHEVGRAKSLKQSAWPPLATVASP
jgi:DNA-binding NtrC family response regulator